LLEKNDSLKIRLDKAYYSGNWKNIEFVNSK